MTRFGHHFFGPNMFVPKINVHSSDSLILFHYFRWCNPCKALTPRIESVIAEKDGKVVLAKVDIDEHANLADDYDVSLCSLKSTQITHISCAI